MPSLDPEQIPPVAAVIGGAVAGSEAAGVLAEHGIVTVVFEQHRRPYGKIEDGLPIWHDKLRLAEFKKIDSRLSQENVHYVPETRIGDGITLDQLTDEWGFGAILIATGAWQDRRLPIDGIDNYLGRGLEYQNPFITWYNNHLERGFEGRNIEIPDRAIVVGGGLASIDVAKAMQFELVTCELQKRGLIADPVEFETKGIPEALARRGLTWDELGLSGATLFYRRRVQDMPLSTLKDDPTQAEIDQAAKVRQKLLDHAQKKYLFHFVPNRAPLRAIVEGDRLAGIVFSKTEMRDGKLVQLDEIDEVRAPLTVSSIGSVPVLFPELPRDRDSYRLKSQVTGEVEGHPHLFALGNGVTGRGNIVASRKHGHGVARHVLERYLGGNGVAADEAQIDAIADTIARRPRLTPAAFDRLLARVRERQQAVGHSGKYLGVNE